MKRSPARLLRSLSEQAATWIGCFRSNDETKGDIADRGSALSEIYRVQAIRHVLSTQAPQNRSKRTHRRHHKCEQCGRRISKQRLRVLPRATRCIKCQKQFEQALPNHRRLVCT